MLKNIKFESVIVLAFSAALVLGCNRGNKEKNVNPDVQVEDTVFEPAVSPAEDSIRSITNKSMLWNVDDAGLKLLKPTVPGIETMPAKNLIHLINNNYDSIHLDYIKISHDTIYVHIPRSETLTQRIGTTGAESYMASVTWSLTELKNVRYVNFDFEEGDHASPGVYDRDSFKSFK